MSKIPIVLTNEQTNDFKIQKQYLKDIGISDEVISQLNSRSEIYAKCIELLKPDRFDLVAKMLRFTLQKKWLKLSIDVSKLEMNYENHSDIELVKLIFILLKAHEDKKDVKKESSMLENYVKNHYPDAYFQKKKCKKHDVGRGEVKQSTPMNQQKPDEHEAVDSGGAKQSISQTRSQKNVNHLHHEKGSKPSHKIPVKMAIDPKDELIKSLQEQIKAKDNEIERLHNQINQLQSCNGQFVTTIAELALRK